MTTFTEQQKARAKDASNRRKLGSVVSGIDLSLAFAAYRKHPPFVGNLGRHVKLVVGHRAEARWSGHAAVYRRKIRVAFGPSATKAEVLEVLMHEMVHLACPRRENHGERFRLSLRRAAKELWGIEVPLLKPSERGAEINAAYAMDRLIMAELEKKIAEGAVELFPPIPKTETPRLSRAELAAKTVERRALHAIKMEARAEKRAKSAQRILAKWRAKVRYYEKRAASKGA